MGNSARRSAGKARGNGAVVGAKSGIPGEIDRPARRLDHVAQPQRAVAIEQAARGPVLRRHAVDRASPGPDPGLATNRSH